MRTLQIYSGNLYGGIEKTLRAELARVTMEDVLRDVLAVPR